MAYSDHVLRQVFILVKNGASREKIQSLLLCSKDEATRVYTLACDKFGRGPYKLKEAPEKVKEVVKKEPKFERPAAEYTNKGHAYLLEKYNN